MTKTLPLALTALLAAGCAAKRIPGTEIEDTDDSRAILHVMEEYRTAVEAKDSQKVIGLVADSFADTFVDEQGILVAVDYAKLRERLPQIFAKLDTPRLDMTIRKIDFFPEEKTARAVFTYNAGYKMPGLNPKPQSDSEIEEMKFKRVGETWKIVSGI